MRPSRLSSVRYTKLRMICFVVPGSVVARSNNSFRAYLTIGLVNVVQASVCLSVMIVRCFQERMPLSRAPGRPLITYYYDSACLGLCRKRSVNCSVLRLAVFLICPGVQVRLCPHPTVKIQAKAFLFVWVLIFSAVSINIDIFNIRPFDSLFITKTY